MYYYLQQTQQHLCKWKGPSVQVLELQYEIDDWTPQEIIWDGYLIWISLLLEKNNIFASGKTHHYEYVFIQNIIVWSFVSDGEVSISPNNNSLIAVKVGVLLWWPRGRMFLWPQQRACSFTSGRFVMEWWSADRRADRLMLYGAKVH